MSKAGFKNWGQSPI